MPIHIDFLSPSLDISGVASEPRLAGRNFGRSVLAQSFIENGEIRMVDLVDVALPTNAQVAAETLGLRVTRSVTSGARIRQIPREDAEIAIECLRDWGFSARIVESDARSEDGLPYGIKPAA